MVGSSWIMDSQLIRRIATAPTAPSSLSSATNLRYNLLGLILEIKRLQASQLPTFNTNRSPLVSFPCPGSLRPGIKALSVYSGKSLLLLFVFAPK